MYKKNRFLLFLFIFSIIALSSCEDEDLTIEDRKVTEDLLIANFLSKNNLTANKTESGIYYRTINEGSLSLVGSEVQISYKVWLMGDDVFDQGTLTLVNDGTSNSGQILAINGEVQVDSDGQPLEADQRSATIEGITEILTVLHEGEKIICYIPSNLAYGAGGISPHVPPNAILVFEIESI